MEKKDRPFTIQNEQVNRVSYSCKSNCNEIMFVNLGAVVVLIDKFPLNPNPPLGNWIAFGGNANELMTRVFAIEGATGDFWVFRKIYL